MAHLRRRVKAKGCAKNGLFPDRNVLTIYPVLYLPAAERARTGESENESGGGATPRTSLFALILDWEARASDS